MNAWWHEVWVTLQAEFADIGDASQLTRITVRLLMAAVLGGILGFEREQKGKAAGVRTHMLVALGAALFVLVPQMSGSQADAMSRVVQGVIAGIGFLGAGTILKNTRGRRRPRQRPDHRRRVVDDRRHRRLGRVGARGDGGAQYVAGVGDSSV